MDAWVAYAPVKNNPEDAAKVLGVLQLKIKRVFLLDGEGGYLLYFLDLIS